MGMGKYQKQVDKWAGQFEVPYWKPHEIMTRLMEEVGELAREVNHRWGPKKKKEGEAKKELADETADVIFTLICLANSQKIDLDKAWERVMEKCWGRDKNRYKKK